MAPQAALSDPDIGDGSWAGGSLTIIRTGGANTQDTFSATGTLSALTQGAI